MYDALLNLLNWIKTELARPIRNALTTSQVFNTLIERTNHLINRLLGLINGNYEEFNYITSDLIGELISVIVLTVAIMFIAKIIVCMNSSIASWISGDTIIITNVRERRKRKNKRG